LPELELGAFPELKPLELELPVFEDEPELEDEPVLPDPVLPDPVLLDEPVLLDPVLLDEPVLEEPELVEVPAEVAVLCVDPGRARVTAPAATTLAMVTAVVAERTLARPRSRAAMARWTLSRGALLMSPSLRSRTRSLLQESSRLAMRAAAAVRCRLSRDYPANMKGP
jgi:hypothetical protein